MSSTEIILSIIFGIILVAFFSVVFYEKIFKRIYDFVFSFIAVIVLSPLFMILSVLGAIILKGNPFFLQKRPGKNEKLFKMIKFRTMVSVKDENGKYLSDNLRLTAYGKFLRNTSLDELPQLLNILKGDMSFVGPRPMMVKHTVFMTDEQKRRFKVRGGITGLAQVNGRNLVSWEKKLAYDLEYVEKITLFGDVNIIFRTVKEVLSHTGVNENGQATHGDSGDYLLGKGIITQEEYNKKMALAEKILKGDK